VADHCEEPTLAKGGAMNEGLVSARLGLKGVPAEAEEIMAIREFCSLANVGPHSSWTTAGCQSNAFAGQDADVKDECARRSPSEQNVPDRHDLFGFAGTPLRPRRALTSPSFIAPPWRVSVSQ